LGVPVWAENWHAALLFNALSRQWHMLVGPTGAVQRVCLRLAAVDVMNAAVRPLVQRHLRRRRPELLRQLAEMESAALEALAERRAG
jgi:hypothetical protein